MALERFIRNFLVTLLVVKTFTTAQAKTVEILAVRHGESMNNVLSKANNPFRFLKDLVGQRNKLKEAGGSPFHNPVLSGQGRIDSRKVHKMIFPNEQDTHNIFSGESPYKAVIVSPLHRTIQTSMLLFGTQMYRHSIPMIPLPSLSEHRKSKSEDGSNIKYLIKLFEYEHKQLKKQGITDTDLKSKPFKTWQESFIREAMSCCAKKWWPAGTDLKNKIETEKNLSKRIEKVKETIKLLNQNRVILVSHGSFMRTFFFGLEDLKFRKHLIKNLGFIKASLDTQTGVLSNISCWDPSTAKASKNPVCFRKK